MKLNKFIVVFAAAVYATAFASCSKDNMGENKINPGTNPTETAYVAIKINTVANAGGTRAYGDELDATEEELAVKSIRVVLYNMGNTVSKAWDVENVTTNGDKPAHDDIFSATNAMEFQLRAVEVPKQDYRLLVLINPTADAIEATAETANISLLNNGIIGITAADFTSSSYGFFMSNADGLVAVSENDLKATTEEAEDAPKSVNVDRAVAKVGVKQGSSFETNSTTDLFEAELLGWALDVTNKSSLYVRKASMAVGEGGPGDENVEIPTTPRVNRYAIDKNYAGVRGGDVSLTDEFDYFTSSTDDGLSSEVKTSLDAPTDWVYALENTMTPAEQYQDVTTSIVVKAKFLPKKTSLGADINVPYYTYTAGGATFIFSGEELDKIVLGKDNGGEDIDTDSYPALTGMKTQLEAIKMAEGAFDGSNDDDYFATFDNASSVQEGALSWNIDGTNYYRQAIRHFDDERQSTVMGLGRFGVVRNNIYELTVNRISGPGQVSVDKDGDGPGDDDDPKDPNEKENANISVTINILKWVSRTQDVNW